MTVKEIAILIVFLVFIAPLLVQIFAWGASSLMNPSSDNIEKGAELIAKAVVPWWIGVMEWLAGWGGAISAILIIALIIFLKWIGEIR